MEKAKVFETGRSQAVRLPKKYRFSVDEVVIQKVGNSLILTPVNEIWETVQNGINSFTDDFFEDGRAEEIPSERENL